MKKILILIIELILIQGVFAMKVSIGDLRLEENAVSFTMNISDLNNIQYYCTNLKNPWYKINENVLYIYFSQIAIPEEVCMDFPEVVGDEIITDNICLKERILLDEKNYIPFENKTEKIEIKSIKKIVFIFGYIDEYDKTIIFGKKENSIKQREKFYYVINCQKNLYIEVCL